MNDQQKLRDRTDAARQGAGAEQEEQARGISPVNPSSMPRAEDDDETFAHSPEYHDRVPNDPATPDQGAASEGYDYTPDGSTNRPDSAS